MSDHLDLKSLLEAFLKAEEAFSFRIAERKMQPSRSEAATTELHKAVEEVVALQSEIVETLTLLPTIPNLEDQRFRAVIKRLTGDSLARVEQKAGRYEEEMLDELVPPGEEDRTWDFVYASGTPYETYLRYQSFPPLVTAVPLPDEIVRLVEEARRSHAWGHRLAALVVGRMILECGMNDIGQRIGLFRAMQSLDAAYRDYPPGKRATDLFGGRTSPRRKEFSRLYDIGSAVVHARFFPDLPWPPKYIGDVIRFLVKEYEIHADMIQKREKR